MSKLAIILGTAFVLFSAALPGRAAESGDAVVVVFNKNVPESRDVAEYYAVTDAQVIEASQWAFSGRMTWTDAGWNYCTGQYWPTEYRAAVVAVLRYALPAHEGRNI